MKMFRRYRIPKILTQKSFNVELGTQKLNFKDNRLDLKIAQDRS